MFHDERFRDLLRKNTEFRNAVTGEAVVDLYRLNRMGRLDDDHGHAAMVAVAAGRQVGLLASLQNSGTAESTYLHFREVARHVLIPEGCHSRVVRSNGAAHSGARKRGRVRGLYD
jgi:hypothetical protein